MKLASQFAVPAAPDKVFAMFFDTETMRACIPGCEELRRVGDRHYAGKLVNEVAHVRFTAGFTAEIQSVSEPTAGGRGTVQALLKGEDRRLGSTIKVDATITVSPQGEESLVAYEFDMAMWGKLGRLGEPVIRRRTVEVQQQFAEALAAVASGRPVPAAGTGSQRAQPAAAPAVAPAEAAPVGLAVTEAPPGRSRDVPFVIAVAAAAFAFGVIVGGRGRRR